MLKIIAGLQSPTSGSVSIPNDIIIGYLPQQMTVTDTRSLIEEAKSVFSFMDDYQYEIDRINIQLA